jgi:precorrin-2 dehydrogenase / sirohydrochlorin ferrochelatase
MRYYPINLDVKDKNCLVVGAGKVGLRKINTLIECGAKVFVVSGDTLDEIKKLNENNMINLFIKKYETKDLDKMFLVIGAINNMDISRQISLDAREKKVLCNIADVPSQCDFVLPSIVNRDPLVISISTSGKSPAFAKKMRKDMEKKFGVEYKELLKLMGAIRKKLLKKAHEPEAHKHLFEKIINSNILDMIKEKNIKAIDALFLEVLGEEYKYNNLI